MYVMTTSEFEKIASRAEQLDTNLYAVPVVAIDENNNAVTVYEYVTIEDHAETTCNAIHTDHKTALRELDITFTDKPRNQQTKREYITRLDQISNEYRNRLKGICNCQ